MENIDLVKDPDTVNPGQPLKALSFMTKWIAVLQVSGMIGFRGLALMALGDPFKGTTVFLNVCGGNEIHFRNND